MATTKLYPFSTRKHANDIDFRRDRCANEIAREYAKGESRDNALIEKLEALQENLDAIRNKMAGACDAVVWLTGKEWALANECIGWAAGQRR